MNDLTDYTDTQIQKEFIRRLIRTTPSKVLLGELSSRRQKTEWTTDSRDGFVDFCCAFFEIPKDDLLGVKGPHRVYSARQVAMVAATQLFPITADAAARAFGRLDHATVLHAKKRVAQDREQAERLEALLTAWEGRHSDTAGRA